MKASIAALICVPRSVQWNAASWTTAPHPSSWQYQRMRSIESAGLRCSMTTPTVSAKRTGLCGVLPGSRNMSPSRITMSLKTPSSTTLRSMAPLYW
ncbi:hypothetical protein RRF57_000251 [Xylaria bambusicola]|uniref:Uncharacterized protein n=1 Tax=Xylaria bambusicola TaxID=326684 RepID=A0AAN7UCJ2_9PEZI